MYSSAIINPEQAFHSLPSGSDRFILVLPLNSFSEGAPFLVEIPPYSGLSPMNLNASEQVPSLVLDTTLSGFGYYTQCPDQPTTCEFLQQAELFKRS